MKEVLQVITVGQMENLRHHLLDSTAALFDFTYSLPIVLTDEKKTRFWSPRLSHLYTSGMGDYEIVVGKGWMLRNLNEVNFAELAVWRLQGKI